jgi:S1-C subfamily serine protease
MNETDLPPQGVDESPGGGLSGSPPPESLGGWGGPPPPPRPPRRRGFRYMLALAALLAAAAAALIALDAAHVFRAPTRTARIVSPSTSGSVSSPSNSFSVTQSRGSGGVLSSSTIAATVDPGLADVNVVFGNQGARGAGTGMVLTSSGVVLTNNHVINGATSIRVTDIGNGKTYSATVVGYDRTGDIAVLQLQGASGLKTVPLGDSSTVTTGARVTALGNAGGVGGTPSMARGTVTALSQTITATDVGGGNAQQLNNLIETNAAIQPGDSGGPLVNSGGQVIGMDAAASVGFTGRPSMAQGYAIPIDTAIAISKQIESGVGTSTVHVGPTAFLGVAIAQTGQSGGFGGSPSGALIGGTLPGYPAAKAGLAQGDVITSLNGQAVSSGTALTELLSGHHPGDTITLQWTDSAGQTHSAAITLASGPAT